ncbi:hypothetical protein [uncultured Clostridium sp.]|uniref:hypothetical protein n=1 Tax=uncultured Clostridium sp. TaxID=59620 RepID=UPI0025E773AC|nr:hypothetical protein [uncultured Clostridium sp.]
MLYVYPDEFIVPVVFVDIKEIMDKQKDYNNIKEKNNIKSTYIDCEIFRNNDDEYYDELQKELVIACQYERECASYLNYGDDDYITDETGRI